MVSPGHSHRSHSPSPSAPSAHLRVAMKPVRPHYLARVQHGAPMHSTPNPKQTDPRDIIRVVPEDKELSNLARDAMRYSSDPQTRMGSDFSAGPPIPPVNMTFRPAAAVNNIQVPGDRPSIGRRGERAFRGFLLIGCIGGAGAAWLV